MSTRAAERVSRAEVVGALSLATDVGMSLPLESGLVLGILPQVTQLDRLGDSLGQKDVQFMAELIDLAAQLFPHFTDHGSNQTL